jgi:1-phosphofructokinase
MIYTVTLNPALDYNIQFDKFETGTLNPAKLSYFLAGGKGINVSKVLKNLGKDSVAMGFVGGFTGDYIKRELSEKGIEYDFIELDETTRVNIKLKDSNDETEIAGIAPKISEEKQKLLLDELMKIGDGDILVLAGSIPNGVPKDFYAKIISELKGVKVILDTRGEAFDEGIKAKPFLVKPNIHELEEYLGEKFENIDDIVAGAKKLMNHGVQNVIVSMGGDGSLFLTGEKVYLGNIPKGNLKNSVGAGDSMVAGFVSALVEGLKLEEAYMRGIASGSATAYSYSLAERNEVFRLLEEIRIKEL